MACNKFISFALIGFLNTLLHGLVLVIMVELFFLSVVISHLVAFMMANVFSYILNSLMTFKEKLSLFVYFRFFIASLMGLILTLFMSWTMDALDINYMVSFGAIVVVVPVFSFLLVKFYAFGQAKKINLFA